MDDSLTSHYQVIIVGGGPAGLSAALVLGLARRRVLVLDAGEPRNAAAPVSHGYLTRDGAKPSEIDAAAREELRRYPHVVVVRDTAVDVQAHGWVLAVATAEGHIHRTRKLILAAGVVDVLPAVPGLRECWGASVFPCPYCHAWEYRDQPLAILGNGPGIFRLAAIVRGWSNDVALLTNGPPNMDAGERMLLFEKKVPLYDQPVARFEHEAGQLTRVVFANDTHLNRRAIVYHPPVAAGSDLPQRLGLIDKGVFRVNPQTAQTSHPDIYVAGDLVGQFGPPLISSAVYSGAFTARSVNEALAVEDFTATVR